MRKVFLSALGFTLLLASCTTPLKDRNAKIKIKTPENWTALGDELHQPFSNGWVKDIADPFLPDLIARSLAHNYNLKAVAAQLEISRANTIISGADRYPQIFASVSGSRLKRTGTSGFALISNQSETVGITFDINWEIDLWGRLKDRARSSVADFQASESDYRSARLSLAGRTSKSWFNAVETELQVMLAKNTLESFEDNLEIVEERFRKGITRALDVRLIRTNVASAKSNLQSRLRLRDEEVRRLEVMMGHYPSYQIVLASELPIIVQSVPSGLPVELLKRRPDIRAAESRLAAADNRVKVSKKNKLPVLRLTASGGTSTNELTEILNTEFKTWGLFGNLIQPLIQGGRIAANINRSQAIRAQTLADYEQIVLKAFREVESTLAAEVYLKEQEAALGDGALEALEAERLAWNQYQKGLIDIVTVLESQRRAFDSKRQLLQISNQRLQNRINLYLALGGDFGQLAETVIVGRSNDERHEK